MNGQPITPEPGHPNLQTLRKAFPDLTKVIWWIGWCSNHARGVIEIIL
ncbi:MAG: hypothetical protein Q7T20_19160 [Saprospiraceae bacterium]|nr:hypothetical protein [Saprospiraceae bacterium]